MKTKEKLSVYGLTDMGRQRTNNEDAFVAKQMDINTVLAVAIDGVGGYEGGEVAAEIARTEIPKYLQNFQNGERLELLKQAVVSANNAIFDRRQVDTARPSMSCVLTSAIVDKQRKVIDMVHVGDTRLYQFHHGELRKLSHDHSLIGYREEMGDLTEEQAMHHPQRNVISRDVGSAKHEVADRDFLEAAEFPLLPNSIFLLCSDGLTDLITSKQIIEVLKTGKNLTSKAKSLIAAANEAGGKDNITVVLVEYIAEEKEKTVNQTEHEQVREEGGVAPVKESDKGKEDKINVETKDMKKLNLVGTIAVVIVFLLCGVCLFYTYRVNQKLVNLQSQFENHLQYSDLQTDGVFEEVEVSLDTDSLLK
ncbi:MAG: protein phosphatase 2C domain-containing protein [Paludibacteraceae bacterium]|nr:protein phosphatase 2C domain-containing protein [Paludibacteraceae bacterium]